MWVYRTTGLRLLLMGAAVALARTVATGSWLPHSGKGVLLFALAELFLIPLGLLLLMWSLLLGFVERRRAGRQRPVRASGAVTGLSLLLVVVFVIGVFPLLSRGLGWGRYGVPIEEPLRDLHDVTTLSGIPVPREAKLVKGTIRWHDPNRYVYAVMEMPRGAAERYLKGEGDWKWWTVANPADLPLRPPPGMEGELAGKAGITYITGGGPPRTPYEAPATTIGAVALGKDDRARIYIYWLPPW